MKLNRKSRQFKKMLSVIREYESQSFGLHPDADSNYVRLQNLIWNQGLYFRTGKLNHRKHDDPWYRNAKLQYHKARRLPAPDRAVSGPAPF